MEKGAPPYPAKFAAGPMQLRTHFTRNMTNIRFTFLVIYVIIPTKAEYWELTGACADARVKRERSANLRQDRCCEVEPQT